MGRGASREGESLSFVPDRTDVGIASFCTAKPSGVVSTSGFDMEAVVGPISIAIATAGTDTTPVVGVVTTLAVVAMSEVLQAQSAPPACNPVALPCYKIRPTSSTPMISTRHTLFTPGSVDANLQGQYRLTGDKGVGAGKVASERYVPTTFFNLFLCTLEVCM